MYETYRDRLLSDPKVAVRRLKCYWGGRMKLSSITVRVISEEFGNWTDSRRRIDLLGIDKEANLVVIEIKRTEDGGHLELQAIRYAAMVSAMTFDNVVSTFETYVTHNNLGIPDAKNTCSNSWIFRVVYFNHLSNNSCSNEQDNLL
jgi:hypothetical protein